MTKARDVSSRGGMTQVIPTSITVGSGSGSVSANGTITFSAASSIIFDNAFTSTYQNYRIVFRPTGSSSASLNLETRTSGTTNSLNYFTAVWGYNYVGGTGGIFQNNTASFNFLPAHTPERTSWICEVIDPKSTVATSFQSFGNIGDAYYHGGCMFLNAASVDGLRISTNSGTFSGTIRIYGYNNG